MVNSINESRKQYIKVLIIGLILMLICIILMIVTETVHADYETYSTPTLRNQSYTSTPSPSVPTRTEAQGCPAINQQSWQYPLSYMASCSKCVYTQTPVPTITTTPTTTKTPTGTLSPTVTPTATQTQAVHYWVSTQYNWSNQFWINPLNYSGYVRSLIANCNGDNKYGGLMYLGSNATGTSCWFTSDTSSRYCKAGRYSLAMYDQRYFNTSTYLALINQLTGNTNTVTDGGFYVTSDTNPLYDSMSYFSNGVFLCYGNHDPAYQNPTPTPTPTIQPTCQVSQGININSSTNMYGVASLTSVDSIPYEQHVTENDWTFLKTINTKITLKANTTQLKLIGMPGLTMVLGRVAIVGRTNTGFDMFQCIHQDVGWNCTFTLLPSQDSFTDNTDAQNREVLTWNIPEGTLREIEISAWGPFDFLADGFEVAGCGDTINCMDNKKYVNDYSKAVINAQLPYISPESCNNIFPGLTISASWLNTIFGTSITDMTVPTVRACISELEIGYVEFLGYRFSYTAAFMAGVIIWFIRRLAGG